jgi:hypothetical protein
MKKQFCWSFCRLALPCTTAALMLLAAEIARASSFTVTLEQEGNNVVATGSGTVDLTGLSLGGPLFNNDGFMHPNDGVLDIGGASTEDYYISISGPVRFGSGGSTDASTYTGDPVGITAVNSWITLPTNYVSDTPLSGSATWDNATLASLEVTPGTYTWTWDNGANSYVLDIESPATVPEPSSLLLVGTALLFGLWVARRRVFSRLSTLQH